MHIKNQKSEWVEINGRTNGLSDICLNRVKSGKVKYPQSNLTR